MAKTYLSHYNATNTSPITTAFILDEKGNEIGRAEYDDTYRL